MHAVGAEARSLATMSEQVAAPSAFRRVPLPIFSEAQDGGLAGNFERTTSAYLGDESSLRSLDAALITPRPVAGRASLEAVANRQGTWGSLQTIPPGAHRRPQRTGGAAMTPPMVTFGLGDAANRTNGHLASPWSRVSETNILAAAPEMAAMGGVQPAAVFSAAAVIESASGAMPISSRSHLTFSAEPPGSSFQPIRRPFETSAGLIDRVR